MTSTQPLARGWVNSGKDVDSGLTKWLICDTFLLHPRDTQMKKQNVPLEKRIRQSLIIGAELMLIYAMIVMVFDIQEPFEDAKTRAFNLMILPIAVTLTIHSFRVAKTAH
ncbi:MAG: hypothetical protein AAB337_03700 [Patescibacteria group bacterium]